MAARQDDQQAPPPRESCASASESIVPEKDIARKGLELKRLWNSSLLICRLPDELLVHIFVEFLEDIRTSYGHWKLGSQHRPMGWPALMLVCSQWRGILVSTPAFWRRIDLKRPVDWMKLCLSRSAQASVDVVGYYRDPCFFDMLSAHAHRFRTFGLDNIPYDQELPTALSVIFSDHGPSLEDLHFSVLKDTPSDIDFKLTAQRFPRLRIVELASVVAPRDVSLFAQLRMLSLSDCSHHLSFDAFLDALAACSQLEELVLNATLNHLSDDEWTQTTPIPWRPPISLPRLLSLTLGGHTPVHTSRFLAHVRVQPSTVHLCLSALSFSHPLEHPLSATTNIRAMLPPAPSATLAILAVVRRALLTVEGDTYEILAGGACLSFGPGAPPDAEDDCHPQASLSLFPGTGTDAAGTVGDPNWDGYMAQGLRDLAAALAHAPLTRLVVVGTHRYGTAGAWVSVFRTFARLEELEVRGWPASDVSCVFLGLHGASAGRGCPVASPALRRVHVEGVGTVETYEVVRVCFRNRGERGVVLSFLHLALWDDSDDLVSEARRACVVDLGEAVKCLRVGYDGADGMGTQP